MTMFYISFKNICKQMTLTTTKSSFVMQSDVTFIVILTIDR